MYVSTYEQTHPRLNSAFEKETSSLVMRSIFKHPAKENILTCFNNTISVECFEITSFCDLMWLLITECGKNILYTVKKVYVDYQWVIIMHNEN